MLARQSRDFFVPAQRATYSVDFVRYHRLAVSRSPKDKAALALAPRNRFGCGPDEKGIVHRVLAKRAEIFDFVTERSHKLFHFLFVTKTGVIRAERNFHSSTIAQRFNAGQRI